MQLLVNKKPQVTSEDVFRINIGKDSYADVCRLWDGVILWGNSVHENKIEFPGYETSDWNYISLNICQKGRCEVKLSNDRYVYMMPGNMCINAEKPEQGYIYPGELYEGIEIVFDRDVFKHQDIRELASYGLSGDYLRECVDNHAGCFMASLDETVLGKSRALYEALLEKNLSQEAYRFYALEILFLIKNGGAGEIKSGTFITKGQRKIAVEAEKIIMKDFREHHTVEEMAGVFGISPSALKKYFEAVYGKPVSHYLRENRMQKAKELLSRTEKSVGEIASFCGYENQGKFGSAFKAYTGESPLEYRRNNKVYIMKEGKV